MLQTQACCAPRSQVLLSTREGEALLHSNDPHWYILFTPSLSSTPQNVLARIITALYHKYDSLQQLGSVEGLTKAGDPESVHTKKIHSGIHTMPHHCIIALGREGRGTTNLQLFASWLSCHSHSINYGQLRSFLVHVFIQGGLIAGLVEGVQLCIIKFTQVTQDE